MAKKTVIKTSVASRVAVGEAKESLSQGHRISNLLDMVGKYLPDFNRAKDLQLAISANTWAEDLVEKYNLQPQEDIVSDRLAVVEALCRYAKVGRTAFLAALLYPLYAQLMRPPPYSDENPDHLKALEEKFSDNPTLGKNIADIIRAIITFRNLNPPAPSQEVSETPKNTQSEEERTERFLMMLLFESAKEPRASLIRLTEMLLRLKTLRTTVNIPQRQKLIDAMKSVYIPLAAMSGFGLLRNAMANTVLRHEHPKIYGAIKNFRKIYTTRFSDTAQDKTHQAVLDTIQRQIRETLTRNEGEPTDTRFDSKDFKIDVRMKSIESIYRKLEKKGVFEKFIEDGVPYEAWGAEVTTILQSGKHIHDFIGTRVILSDEFIARRAQELNKCAAEVEHMESLRVQEYLRSPRMDASVEFVPDTRRDKDYFKEKKDNGYSAVHGTYVIKEHGPAEGERKGKSSDEQGEIEVQSGSESTFNFNENGPAAHVVFKASGSKLKAADLVQVWLKVMRQACYKKLPYEYASKQIARDSEGKVMRDTKGEITTRDVTDLIAVFTASGDIIYLPSESTAADLAAKLRIVASAVGIATIERPNFFIELKAANSNAIRVINPDKPSIEDMGIRLQNGDRVVITLDRQVLAKEMAADDDTRQTTILGSLTNSSAQSELRSYFKRKKRIISPEGPN